jgi:hypothetical protein
MADIDFEVISSSEYEKRTRGRGRGRRSKYDELGKQASFLKAGQVIAARVSKNQVLSLRNHFKRRHGEEFTVRSIAADDGGYDVYIQRAE